MRSSFGRARYIYCRNAREIVRALEKSFRGWTELMNLNVATGCGARNIRICGASGIAFTERCSL
jgi:predicted phage tail protein